MDELMFNYIEDEDDPFELVEDVTMVTNILYRLDNDELRVVKFLMEGRRFPHRTRQQDTALLQRTIERIRNELA